MDEANGDDVYGEDDEEIDRFDCCDDSDGDSSGDEDYYPSDYIDKDEEGEITDDEEEVKEKAKDEMWSRKETKSSSPVKKNACWSQRTEFLPRAIIGSNDIAVGQKYDSKAAIARRLKILSVIQKFDFKVVKSYPDLYVVKCRVEGCKWRVRAAVVQTSPLLQIRKYQRHHTCSVTERSKTSRKATLEILGALFKEFVGSAGARVLPKHVEISLRLHFGIVVDYWKSHRTLKAARILDRGTPEQGYEDLPSYLYRIKSSNLGTYYRLEVDELDRFKYVFIAFGASTAGFRYMRKVIVVDGTFLKGKYLGTLLLATTQDGNYNIFPLAFAVVDTENDASWEWFFSQLSHVIPDDEVISIISDRHKSIGKAIGKVYPRLRYGGKETFGYVKKAATAYSIPEFDHYYGRIKDANPQLHKYLEGADVGKWSRVHFKGDRYNFTTTNIAESINKVLKPARLYPIAQLLDEIRLMLTIWFAARRKQAAIMATFLTTGVQKKLEV